MAHPEDLAERDRMDREAAEEAQFNIDDWTVKSFNFLLSGTYFRKDAGTEHFEVNGSANEVYADDPNDLSLEMPKLISAYLETQDSGTASDREVAIGEHAFGAGYNIGQQDADDKRFDLVKRWSQYTPPEDLCGGGSKPHVNDGTKQAHEVIKAPLPVGIEDTPEVRAKAQALLEYKFNLAQHVAIVGGVYDGHNGQVRELLRSAIGERSYAVKVLTGPDRDMRGTCVISERDLRAE